MADFPDKQCKEPERERGLSALRIQQSTRERQITETCGALDVLLLRAGRGDRRALAELYDHTAPLMYALCLSHEHSEEAARERLVTVFVEVWRQAPLYERTGALAWLFHVARR